MPAVRRRPAPATSATPKPDVAVRRRIYVSARRGGLARPALAAMADELRAAAAAR
jgi:hypothetical protein